jgi:hypothetical protein
MVAERSVSRPISQPTGVRIAHCVQYPQSRPLQPAIEAIE